MQVPLKQLVKIIGQTYPVEPQLLKSIMRLTHVPLGVRVKPLGHDPVATMIHSLSCYSIQVLLC